MKAEHIAVFARRGALIVRHFLLQAASTMRAVAGHVEPRPCLAEACRRPRGRAHSRLLACAAIAMGIATLGACGGGDAVATKPSGLPGAVATVQNPPSDSGQAFGLAVIDLPSRGYVEQEFLVSGTANRYRMEAPGGQTYASPPADAQLVDGGHAYTTRILVRRPTDAAKFNGSVLVEWLNVTLNQDGEFFFAAAREHILAQGYAWVGVSAQLAGANTLKNVNPIRYAAINLSASNVDPNGGTLDPRGDVLSWDVFAQVGAVLRKPAGIDPLGGLSAARIFAVGQSQSAFRLTSYLNSINPLYPKVFDGFVAYDRLGNLRSDLTAKVISVATEITAPPLAQRTPDIPSVHVWEIAGASHNSYSEISTYVDALMLRNGLLRDASGAAVSLTDFIPGCGVQPIWSRVPNGDVLSAAISALQRWTIEGVEPAKSMRIGTDETGAYYRDSDRRVSGGIRLAAYDAPLSTNIGVNTGPGFCFLVGSHVDLTPTQMCSRYGSKENYVAKVVEVTRRAESDRYVLTADANRTIAEAKSVGFTCP